MKSLSTTDLVGETDEHPPIEDHSETDLDTMSSTSPKVAYQPVTVDRSGQIEMDPGREQAYRRRLRKTVNIVAFVIVCLVVLAVLSVLIILLSPRNEGYKFKIVATNITAHLKVGTFPDNATIAEDIERAVTSLINGSIFKEVYVKTVVLEVRRGSIAEVTIRIVLTDLGDHLGSTTGASEEPTDVLDFFLDSIADDKLEGFHIAEWFVEQS